MRIADELGDRIAGPFASLAVIVPMLAAADALYPYSHTAGKVIVDVLIAVTLVLAGWLTGDWIYRPLEFAKLHPGYFLPSVAGGFIASAAAGLVGQMELAKVMFGVGLIAWIVTGSIILGRLIVGPPLPAPLMPTLAIEVAPAAVATFAAFVIDGHRVDALVRGLAGYGLLMVVAQIRLLPAFRRLSFTPSFWAFTFSWSAVAFAGLSWLGIVHPAGWRAESYLVLAVISAFIVAIAIRTAVAAQRGQLIPAPTRFQPPNRAWGDDRARPRSRLHDQDKSRLTDFVAAKGLTVFATIDQAAAARGAGLELRDTVLVVFGDPVAGTPVMTERPLAVLDWPLKVAVWDDDGRTRVSYLKPAVLAARHALSAALAAPLRGIEPLVDAALTNDDPTDQE